MQAQRPITTMKIFDAEAIAAGESALSPAIDLREIAAAGKFTLHYITTGSGTTLFEVLTCSTEGGTYLDADDDIGATLAAGADILAFTPTMAPFIKIRATEDGAAEAIAVTAWLNIQ